MLNPIGYITLRRKDSLCVPAHWFCVSRKGGTGGGGGGHPQGAVHMVAARLGFEKAMVGTGCMPTYSADYYYKVMLINEWVWPKSRDCLLRPEVGGHVDRNGDKVY